MKITLMPNLTREHAAETAMKLCGALKKLGVAYNLTGDAKSSALFDGYPIAEESELQGNTDVLIAIGGDGTMIKAARLALPFDIPVLGVNAGNLAFLMGLETDEMKLLDKLLTSDYYIEERIALKIGVCNPEHESVFSDYCINDAVFARGAEIKLSSFDVYCDDKFADRYTSDGIIVSTPTGSTAYNLAAGGPIVDPGVESIILTPICPHSLTERTILFTSDSIIKVSNPGLGGNQVFLSCDGRDSIYFGKNWGATIQKAEKKSKFIRLKDDRFFDILRKKMKANAI